MPRNCTFTFAFDHTDKLPNARLEPNPDISGIGVLIGFVATAWTSYLFMILHCLVTSKESGNLLDSLLYRGAKRILGKVPSPHWAKVMETVVLAMSDQQLVTGIAILISGLYQLKRDLSFYHWQMITNLAWFSCTTHLSSLMCLEQYFEKHRLIWYARLFLMTGLVIMLAAALMTPGVLETPELTSLPIEAPVICLFDFGRFGLSSVAAIIGVIMLLVGFVVRAVQMFSTTRKFSNFVFQATEKLWRRGLVWSCGKLQASSRWIQALFLPSVFISLAFLVAAQCLLDFVRSRTFGISWQLLSLIWGTMRIFDIRKLGAEGAGHEEMKKENTWEFGQLVPVLLLLIPFLLISEGFSEMFHKSYTLSEEGASNCGISSQTESQWHLQRTPDSTDGNPHTTQNQADQILVIQSQTIESSNASLKARKRAKECAFRPISNRLSSICEEEFRYQPWYRDNLLFFWAIMVFIAVFSLPMAQSKHVQIGNTYLYPLMASLLSVIPPVIIPLYGIQNMIDPMKLTQRHFLSLIRFAIDPGRPYYVTRCVFFLYYSASAFPFSLSYYTGHVDEIMLSERFIPLELTVLICLLALCVAFFMGTFSIYRQVLSQKIVAEV